MLKKFSIIKRIGASPLIRFSHKMSFATDSKPQYSFQDLYEHKWLEYDPTHKNSQKTHKSTAEQNIARIPIIHVNENIVRCMGGTQPGAGHPQIYIQLNVREPNKPSVCKYCGLRYMKKHDDHHHH